MSSISGSLGVAVPLWRPKNLRLFILLRSQIGSSFVPRVICCSNYESMEKKKKMGYDPSEEILGLEVDVKSRKVVSGEHKPRSWFGPNGQYIRELPCPSCRGRGYTPCAECGIERSRLDCPLCNGKGIMTCRQCSGDCVIWEESIDERPWETAHSISPLKVKEDDEVDNLDIKLDKKKKSKRVYQSPPPEVGLKISRSLKSLNAKTGLFSKRMKIIHRDPRLHAQRVAAIKKAKGTAAARKRASETLKAFFSDPENRRKRSIAMKGVKFYCKNCGCEGHRKHYCPELNNSSIDRRFRCHVCGEKGHNRRTCLKLKMSSRKHRRRKHRCKICRKIGHNRRTCPKFSGLRLSGGDPKTHRLISRGGSYSCGLCQGRGHNRRTCLVRSLKPTQNYEELEKPMKSF